MVNVEPPKDSQSNLTIGMCHIVLGNPIIGWIRPDPSMPLTNYKPTSKRVMGVLLASSFSKKSPLLGPIGSSGNKNQNPKPLSKSAPAAALLVMDVSGEVIQNVVGWLSAAVRMPFLVPSPRLWSNRVLLSPPSSRK